MKTTGQRSGRPSEQCGAQEGQRPRAQRLHDACVEAVAVVTELRL